MSLHDLFNAVVDYPITLQGVGAVFELVSVCIALLFALWIAAVFAWAILASIGAELNGEAAKRRRAKREYEAEYACKAEQDRIAQREWMAEQNQRKLDREELNALRAKWVASGRLTDEEGTRRETLEEAFGEAT